ncbi:DUF4956 domain-containing protein [Thermodesulfobacteriota bacterium]
MENFLNFNILQDPLSMQTIIFNLIVAFLLSLLLKWHFEKFGTVFSGKHEIARSLPFLVLIVCLIISIVKSSLALSLGLVGALSIVRFRTAIKEAEELLYLFMAIAIGLGIGANQTLITVVSTVIILILSTISKMGFFEKEIKNFYLSVETEKPSEISPDEVTKLIVSHVTLCDIRKIDVHSDSLQLIYQLHLQDENELFVMIDELKKKYKDLHISFIDQNRTLGS